MAWLALLLMGPWLLILGWAYWYFPRIQRPRSRRLFDAMALVLAAALTTWLTLDSYHAHADAGRHVDALGHHAGAIWQQVLPALLAYGGFVTVLALALLVRSLLWRHQRD